MKAFYLILGFCVLLLIVISAQHRSAIEEEEPAVVDEVQDPMERGRHSSNTLYVFCVTGCEGTHGRDDGGTTP